MASDAKTEGLDCEDAVDRISNLPTDLICHILKYVPIHCAARTSILSKTWRNIWGMHPRLRFDYTFFIQVYMKISKIKNQTLLSEVASIISSILLAHTGPILKFILYIPPSLPLHQCLDMVSWIKYISSNGVKKVKLYNQAQIAYKVPSYLFSCSELTHLRLTNCILNPPLEFGGFCKVSSVKLVNVVITADMSFGTQLDELDLKRCTGIEHLGCQFKYDNNLTVLSIINCGEIDWQWFEYTQKVEDLCLMSDGVEQKSMNLDKLVDNMPRICTLHLNGFFLKSLEPGASVMKRLTATMENLEFLFLYNVVFYDLVQIQYVLWLIRSSPNLQILDIDLEHKLQSSDGIDLLDLMVLSDHMILDGLETLIINEMVGSKAEFQFIKLLLASSPSLRQIELKKSITVDDPKEELRILGELLQFPRASTTAQIQWK